MLLIDGFEVDAEISGEHLLENEVTDHPVETGGDVTDHSRPKPITYTVEGVVSDTPLGNMVDTRSGVTLPSADALARLTGIRDAREPVQIGTSLRTYDNMLMQSLSFTKDASTGRALRFRATFKQVIIATNERIVKRVTAPRAKGKTNRGNKAATPVTTLAAKRPAVNPYVPATRRVKLDDGVHYAPDGKLEVRQDLARSFRSQF